MFKLSRGMEIERPAEVVWPYLLALEQVPLWEGGILDVKLVDAGPLKIGTRFTAGRVYAGRATHLEGDVRAIEYSATGEMRFPLNLLDPFFPALGRSDTRKNFTRLRRRVLTGIPPTSNLPTPE